MGYKEGICWACNKQSPVDSHHVRPLEYGGARDGKQVNICARCHDITHREGEFYYKNGRYYNLQGMADSPSHYANLEKLTKLIATTKQRFKDSEVEDDFQHQRLTSAVTWDNEQERQMAHDVKKAMGFTSLNRAIKALVLDRYERLRRAGRL